MMTRLALVVASLVGVACFALLYRYHNEFERRASGGAAVSVLVAGRELPAGHVLSADDLAQRPLPSDYVEPRHIRGGDAGRVIGIRIATPLHAGESLLWSDLAIAGEEGSSLSSLVRDGMRAVTVRLAHSSALVRPGDRIDLLLRSESAKGPVVVALEQNLLVLAVGGALGRNDGSAALPASPELTVSVTQLQAQALALAESQGELSASLRRPSDITVARGLPALGLDDLRTERAEPARTSSGPKRPKDDQAAREIERVD